LPSNEFFHSENIPYPTEVPYSALQAPSWFQGASQQEGDGKLSRSGKREEGKDERKGRGKGEKAKRE